MKKVLIALSIFMLTTTMICGLSVASQEALVKSSILFHGVYGAVTAALCIVTFFIKEKKKR